MPVGLILVDITRCAASDAPSESLSWPSLSLSPNLSLSLRILDDYPKRGYLSSLMLTTLSAKK